MSDTYGKSVTLTIFGESHGPAVGATVTGLAPGVPVDMEFMRGQMEKRRAKGKISTSRTEADAVRVLSGVYRGAATGTALTLVIENTNTRSGDYTKTEELLRPGHADYTAHMKYGGHQDARGGGHFSPRWVRRRSRRGRIRPHSGRPGGSPHRRRRCRSSRRSCRRTPSR